MILEPRMPVTPIRAGEVRALKGRGRDGVVLVDDREALCASIVVQQARRSAGYFGIRDLEEAVDELHAKTQELLEKYDPTRGRQLHDPFDGGFKGWLHLALSRACIDHWRATCGRAGQRRVFDPRPFLREEEDRLAQLLEPVDPVEDGSDAHADRLAQALGGVVEDDVDHRLPGGLWAVERRYRKASRKVEAVGLGSPRGAAPGHRAAAHGEELAA